VEVSRDQGFSVLSKDGENRVFHFLKKKKELIIATGALVN